MKTYTIKCDICGKEIDWKNEKYHTFEVPGMIDVKENKVVLYETHFCESHDFTSLMLSHSKYELDVIKTLNEWLKQNRWNPAG